MYLINNVSLETLTIEQRISSGTNQKVEIPNNLKVFRSKKT